jgi:non-specific protein-tyrosine kinase
LAVLAESNAAADIVERNRLEGLLAEYNRDYSSLLQSYEQIRLATIEASSVVRQVDEAVAPTSPVRPRILLNTVVGLLLGLLGGVSFVLIRDILDDTVRNPQELSRQVELPILGQIITFDASNQRLVSATQPRSPAAEAFRSLRINIKYASVDRPLHTILITSPEPAEGKSTLASNLGIVLASGGDSVIIIDGDLRRPNVHKAFDLPNPYGTTNLFIEPLDRLPDLLQVTEHNGLSVLTSGPIPPNPSELLDTERAQQIVERAASLATKVIIDAPPIMALTDSLALSQHVDGVLLVVRDGKTRRAATKQAVERLHKVGANIVGLVFTDVDAKGSRYGDYYYYSHYTYRSYFDEEPIPPLPEPTRNGVFERHKTPG